MNFRAFAKSALSQSEGYRPKAGDEPNDSNIYEVTWADLPLSCPLPRMSLWDSHPRVYLPIHKSGHEQCDYCGAIFVLLPPTLGEPKPSFAGGNIEMEAAYHRAIDALKVGKSDVAVSTSLGTGARRDSSE